ncbi:MAG: type II toxin-antitoxin system PemK/MazF family toxin [Christensenellales bacterium]
MEITRGDIFIADLNPVQGSEQGGIRPVLVIQNDRGNRFSPTVICAAMTSRVGKSDLPTHAWVSAGQRLKCDSLVLCEQIRRWKSAACAPGRTNRRHGDGAVDAALLCALGIG